MNFIDELDAAHEARKQTLDWLRKCSREGTGDSLRKLHNAWPRLRDALRAATADHQSEHGCPLDPEPCDVCKALDALSKGGA